MMEQTLATDDYLVHGIRIRVETQHPELAKALAHRLRPYPVPAADPPHLVLRFADELSQTGTEWSHAAWRTVYDLPGGEIRYHAESDQLIGDVAGVRCLADLSTGTAEVACDEWTAERRYIATHTLTTIILMERLERLGCFSLHAGCLASDGNGVLLAGPSGTGKSTLALALALEGLDFLADDLITLIQDGDELRVRGVRDAIGVTDFTQERFPELARADASTVMNGPRKRLIRIEDVLGSSVADVCTPVMLVFPEVSLGHPSCLEPLEPVDAWRRLLPDVLLTAEQSTKAHLQAIATLTERVKCFRLLGGIDLRTSARLIASQL